LHRGKGINNLSDFFQTQNSRQGLFTLPFDVVENVPGSDQCSGKKMLNAGVTDTQCCGAPAEFILAAKPVLTGLFFSDIVKWFILKTL
jgi:hypothetical protein